MTDEDRDHLPDDLEGGLGTDPERRDTDGDGLSDSREARFGSDPRDADSDGDGLRDGREVFLGTDPMNADTDGDRTDDRDETRAGTLTNLDQDHDGRADWLEERDRVRDEDALAPDGTAPDSDGDGLTDVTETFFTHTNPFDPDTDGDGTWDRKEVWEDHTDPRAANEGTDQEWLVGHDHYVDGIGEDPAILIDGTAP